MRFGSRQLLISAILFSSILNYLEVPVEGIPFNAIVPNLSTGWFHKPGPTESLLFGLVVLKVLALRMAGVVPYNLNTLLEEGSYLDNHIFKEWRKRTARDVFFMSPGGSGAEAKRINGFSKAPLSKEMDFVERILLGLRRIDSHDCFIRHVCQIKQRSLRGGGSKYEEAILKIFSMKPAKEAKNSEKSIWDIYHDALSPHAIDCNTKYQLCPLNEKDTSVSSIMSGLF